MANRERSCSRKSQSVCGPFVIEDIKLNAIGSPTEVLSRRPAPKATMPNEEVYHRTWFQEQVRREKNGRHTGRRAVEAMSA
jgi:hypothetical protein